MHFWRHGHRLAIFLAMPDVTRILSQIEQGDPQAAEKLLPLVYDELRKLAAAKLAQEKPGQTLQSEDWSKAGYRLERCLCNSRLTIGKPEVLPRL